MQWFVLYFLASLSVLIVAADLVVFFTTKNYWTLISLSVPVGLMRPVVKHLFPRRTMVWRSAVKSQSDKKRVP